MALAAVHDDDRFRQKIRFDGLQYGSIYPTDIDAFIDFKRRLFVIIEAKCYGVALKDGQRIGLENLAMECKVPTVCLVARHAIPTTEDVLLVECRVTTVLRGPHWKWLDVRSPVTVVEYIDKLITECHLTGVTPRVHGHSIVKGVTTTEHFPVERDLDVSEIPW